MIINPGGRVVAGFLGYKKEPRRARSFERKIFVHGFVGNMGPVVSRCSLESDDINLFDLVFEGLSDLPANVGSHPFIKRMPSDAGFYSLILKASEERSPELLIVLSEDEVDPLPMLISEEASALSDLLEYLIRFLEAPSPLGLSR